jgi:peptidylprolyl isomerase
MQRRSVLKVGVVAAVAAAGCDANQQTSASAEPPASSSAKPGASTQQPAGGKPMSSAAKTAAPVDPKFAPPPDVAAPPADAIKTPSGLAYKVLTPGTGDAHPVAESTVKVHYTGWTTDGKMFDSSVARGQPTSFPLNRVIPGWTEGLQLLKKGEKALIWIPEELAYKGRPGSPAGMLVFEVELLEWTDPPKAPEDVAAPPKDAKKTASGLAYKVLKPGTGTAKPTATSRVEVHYSGWTTDGKMFDSSVTRGRTASFALNGVIKGWTEGLQLMVEGEQTRFWIPVELAYGESPTRRAPRAAQLTFDVELPSSLAGGSPPPAPPSPLPPAPPAALPPPPLPPSPGSSTIDTTSRLPRPAVASANAGASWLANGSKSCAAASSSASVASSGTTSTTPSVQELLLPDAGHARPVGCDHVVDRQRAPRRGHRHRRVELVEPRERAGRERASPERIARRSGHLRGIEHPEGRDLVGRSQPHQVEIERIERDGGGLTRHDREGPVAVVDPLVAARGARLIAEERPVVRKPNQSRRVGGGHGDIRSPQVGELEQEEVSAVPILARAVQARALGQRAHVVVPEDRAQGGRLRLLRAVRRERLLEPDAGHVIGPRIDVCPEVAAVHRERGPHAEHLGHGQPRRLIRLEQRRAHREQVRPVRLGDPSTVVPHDQEIAGLGAGCEGRERCDAEGDEGGAQSHALTHTTNVPSHPSGR